MIFSHLELLCIKTFPNKLKVFLCNVGFWKTNWFIIQNAVTDATQEMHVKLRWSWRATLTNMTKCNSTSISCVASASSFCTMTPNNYIHTAVAVLCFANNQSGNKNIWVFQDAGFALFKYQYVVADCLNSSYLKCNSNNYISIIKLLYINIFTYLLSNYNI